VSEACYKYTGYTKKEHLELSLSDTLTLPHLAYARQLIEEAFEMYEKHGKQYELTFELERFHKDGTTY
jgi:PAS domain-containing protein